MLVFEERGKPEYPEKNLSEQSREPTNSAHLRRRVRESNPGPHWWKASALTLIKWLNGLTNVHLLSVQRQALQTVTRNSYGITSFRCCCRSCHAEHRGTSPSNLQTDTTTLAMVRRRHLYRSSQRRNRRFFMNTLTDRTLTYSLLRRSTKMVKYLF